jgi:thioredoxin reductase
MYTLFPNLFHYLPLQLRLRIVRRHLGPGAGWFVRPLIEGRVTIHAGYSIAEARASTDGAVWACSNEQGQRLELPCDHIIAATGYKPAVAKLPFLSPSLASAIAVEGQTPVLSSNFESSVPGLYFMGVIAANSFGPLLRFALGARFCAGTLSSHLRRVAARPAESPLTIGGERPAE